MTGTGTKARTAITACALALVAISAQTGSASAPSCRPSQAMTTNYQTPVEFTVTCRGTGLRSLTVAAAPANGALRRVKASGQTLTATYVPRKLFVGRDRVKLVANEAGSRTVVPVTIKVLPWRMRALGDSATAGFGFLGASREEMKDLGECEPLEPLNDRCSSNSGLGEGSTAKLEWLGDFGLGNNISWAAQFANKLQGGGHLTAPGMFENRAVSGSTPADWLPKGQLNGWLAKIVKEDPDLIAFTLGVNPLLYLILRKYEEATCIAKASEFQEVANCLKRLFKKVALRKRLEAVYATLLSAEDAKVVTFQYHLATPLISLALFKPWQVEAVIFYLNKEIAVAIAGTKASLPSKASRLTLIEAQVDPTQPDPKKVPRFNLGIPPESAQKWKTTACPTKSSAVDGESHQASSVQNALKSPKPAAFCEGTPWTIYADDGLHPNQAGYTQYAGALLNVARAKGLVPKLP